MRPLPTILAFGSGLSLTVRDAPGLRDALLRYKDWDVAGHVYAVKREGSPSVVVEQAGQIDEIAARLVVGADGRTSLTRK
jgi:2-polyprenyl-6-methoxyphenol hydroxylase-like FAD-dependent oxidoreductase